MKQLTVVKQLTVLFLFLLSSASLYAQPLIKDQQILRPELDKAFEPLKTLNEQQMAAVAGLALAYRAGVQVEDYCPPLKTYTGPQRTPCESAMLSYASAVRDCKKADPARNCPKVLEAEANWSACETKALGKRLQALKVVQQWPKPSPQPKPYTR